LLICFSHAKLVSDAKLKPAKFLKHLNKETFDGHVKIW
jgi:hypothetical protein